MMRTGSDMMIKAENKSRHAIPRELCSIWPTSVLPKIVDIVKGVNPKLSCLRWSLGASKAGMHSA